MDDYTLFENLRQYFQKVIKEQHLEDEKIEITGSVLTTAEAIGNPQRKDFPLQKGKEKLMQAVFAGHKGQAYTDMAAGFSGTLADIASMEINNNYQRAVFIASLNAVLRKLKLIENTVHCKDAGPEKCSKKLVETLSREYGKPKIALFGLQPAMAQALSAAFPLRIFDIDQDNIGQEKFGVIVEDGCCNMADVAKWADVFLVTGSTLGNGTIVNFLNLDKPVIFYGTTVAGGAKVCGLTRFCPEAT